MEALQGKVAVAVREVRVEETRRVVELSLLLVVLRRGLGRVMVELTGVEALEERVVLPLLE